MSGRRKPQDAALPAVQRATQLAGRATARWRILPGLLICGAQRCGTTSMYQALRQHPAMARPVARKGVHFFDVDYPRGLNWYRGHFPLKATTRRRRTAGGRVIAFESSPYYLFHPAAAGRIAVDLPDVKVLILVRDPVERAYSAHAHETARGFETEPFERALELEDERLRGEEQRLLADPWYRSGAHQHQAYVRRGFYIDQIERMTAALGGNRVHVVDAEDFFRTPEAVWPGVLSFLGVDDDAPIRFERHNARPRSTMPEELRERLRTGFDDSDARLERWWGRTPSWRRAG